MVAPLKLEPCAQAPHIIAERLLKKLTQLARDGFAFDREEFMDGMVAIAVPVTDARGRFIAALAYHGPTPRMTLKDAITQLGFLQETAQRLGTAHFEADQPAD